jgi:hypothetical protein
MCGNADVAKPVWDASLSTAASGKAEEETMQHVKDVLRDVMIAAFALLALGLLIGVSSSALELVAMR